MSVFNDIKLDRIHKAFGFLPSVKADLLNQNKCLFNPFAKLDKT